VIASVECKRNPGLGEKITDFEVVILYKKKRFLVTFPCHRDGGVGGGWGGFSPPLLRRMTFFLFLF